MLPPHLKEQVGYLKSCLTHSPSHRFDKNRPLFGAFVQMLDVRQLVIFPPY